MGQLHQLPQHQLQQAQLPPLPPPPLPLPSPQPQRELPSPSPGLASVAAARHLLQLEVLELRTIWAPSLLRTTSAPTLLRTGMVTISELVESQPLLQPLSVMETP